MKTLFHFCVISLFCFVTSHGLSACAGDEEGEGAEETSGAAVRIEALTPAVMAFQTLALDALWLGSGFPTIELTDVETGQVQRLQADGVDPIRVVVPPLVTADGGDFRDGEYDVSVLDEAGAPIGPPARVVVRAPPNLPLGVEPGVLTAAWLEGTIHALNAGLILLSEQSADIATLDYAAREVQVFLAQSRAALIAVDALRAGDLTQLELGEFEVAGRSYPVAMTREDLEMTDRILLAVLLADKPSRKSDGDDELEFDPGRWGEELLQSSAQEILEIGERVASAGKVALGVAVVVALAGGTVVSAPAIATIGAVVFVATTFVPAASALVLNVAPRSLIEDNNDSDAEDDEPTLLDRVRPTLAWTAGRSAGLIARGLAPSPGGGVDGFLWRASTSPVFDAVNHVAENGTNLLIETADSLLADDARSAFGEWPSECSACAGSSGTSASVCLGPHCDRPYTCDCVTPPSANDRISLVESAPAEPGGTEDEAWWSTPSDSDGGGTSIDLGYGGWDGPTGGASLPATGPPVDTSNTFYESGGSDDYCGVCGGGDGTACPIYC